MNEFNKTSKYETFLKLFKLSSFLSDTFFHSSQYRVTDFTTQYLISINLFQLRFYESLQLRQNPWFSSKNLIFHHSSSA